MDTKRLKLNEYVESHLEEPKYYIIFSFCFFLLTFIMCILNRSSESIKSILIAWSIYDQEVGYVQGWI